MKYGNFLDQRECIRTVSRTCYGPQRAGKRPWCTGLCLYFKRPRAIKATAQRNKKSRKKRLGRHLHHTNRSKKERFSFGDKEKGKPMIYRIPPPRHMESAPWQRTVPLVRRGQVGHFPLVAPPATISAWTSRSHLLLFNTLLTTAFQSLSSCLVVAVLCIVRVWFSVAPGIVCTSVVPFNLRFRLKYLFC